MVLIRMAGCKMAMPEDLNFAGLDSQWYLYLQAKVHFTRRRQISACRVASQLRSAVINVFGFAGIVASFLLFCALILFALKYYSSTE